MNFSILSEFHYVFLNIKMIVLKRVVLNRTIGDI